MARGKRTPEETKAKVVELKMQNPELSSHDIEEQLLWTEWEVSNDTVCDILKDLPQLATTPKWEKILDTMDEIIDWIADITRLAINPIRDKVIAKELTVSDLKALNDIAKNNFDRRQLLTGKPTENVNVLWDVLSQIQWLKETN